MEAILERIAVALEESTKLAREAQRDYRAGMKRAQADNQRIYNLHAEHAKKAHADAERLNKLLLGEATRASERDRIVAAELARIADRDEETMGLLRAAGERSAESLDVVKTATGLAAPDYIPEDLLVTVPEDEDDDAV